MPPLLEERQEPLPDLVESADDVRRACLGVDLDSLRHETADRIERVLATPARPRPPEGAATPLPAGPLAVEVAGVRFGYGAAPVLDGVDLALAPGEVVALVGATGAGKSSLCHLLAHLHDPDAGRVVLGGIDLRAAEPASVRRHVALAFQEAFLFAASVRENLNFSEDAPDDEVRWALERARAWGFVSRLPGGLDQVVGERGATLSGGQRQRLALARALLRRPGLLMLDDATSAVDPTIERQILDGLRASLQATTLIVAHRVSTIALADRVLFLDRGRIAATGAHDDLVASVPAYATLARAYEEARAHLERLLDAEVPSLDAAQRRAVIVALCHLDSAATWVTFRREFGMDRRDIADAAAWAAEAVLDSIRDRVAP